MSLEPHISVSQIEAYLRCPAAYYFQYILGIKTLTPAYFAKGRAVHKAQEYNYTQKITTGRDLPLADIQDVTVNTFDSMIREGVDFDDGETATSLRNETLSLATLYHKEIAPTVQPVHVEYKLENIAVPGVPIPLLGYIDVIDSLGFIRDTKTSSKSPSVGTIEKSLQLTAYCMAYRQVFGKTEAGVKLDYLVQTKIPKAITVQDIRTEKDIRWFVSIATHVTDAIMKEAFFPNPNNFNCSQRKCGFWEFCKREFS